jgi:hypothetical protein
MSTTPSYREELVARVSSLYADLGWALPTCIENARLATLESTVDVALNALESRQAAAAGRGRAIDRHEDAICAVIDILDADETVEYRQALETVGAANGLTVERLDQLVYMWCRIAGIEVPS